MIVLLSPSFDLCKAILPELHWFLGLILMEKVSINEVCLAEDITVGHMWKVKKLHEAEGNGAIKSWQIKRVNDMVFYNVKDMVPLFYLNRKNADLA